MCRKMKSIVGLLNLSLFFFFFFYHGIEFAKTRNSVHGDAFEV